MVSKKAVYVLLVCASAQILTPAYAGDEFPKVALAKDDYIICEKQPCVGIAGIRWSRDNPYGVAVSVRIGSKAAVTADQIKQVLTADFKHYGVKNIKFFFEDYEGVASSIGLHVKGGATASHGIDTVRGEIPTMAKYALNRDPVLLPD